MGYGGEEGRKEERKDRKKEGKGSENEMLGEGQVKWDTEKRGKERQVDGIDETDGVNGGVGVERKRKGEGGRRKKGREKGKRGGEKEKGEEEKEKREEKKEKRENKKGERKKKEQSR